MGSDPCARALFESTKHFQQQHAWLLLLEYRFVWYGAVDALALAVLACFGIVSGLSPSNLMVCEIFAVVAVVILMFQLTLVLVLRPYTTTFGHYYTVTVLLLTALSVMAQLVFVFSTAQLDSWLLQGSAICNVATVGVGLTKTLTDLVQLGRAVARRVGCRDGRSKPIEALVELPVTRENVTEHVQIAESDDGLELLDLHWMPLDGTDLVDAVGSDILAIGADRADMTSYDLLSMFTDSSGHLFDVDFDSIIKDGEECE
ncbi:membrane-associated protein, putative [Bodo saltans]|uniref:Membrane-associated protein, putative n=1 Tax=Bodo saltans TaxID=75058 RepID=A0A0S4JB54_BODSA|nr:membrane-associated protein, putative [Bodo saltans]|eukprot:CUG87491.1 membrane-associated protein, putative [Bodo saltans]